MPSFIYQREAEVLAKSINNGQLKQGDRLLSVRDFARERKVGISTAAKIYEHLQRQQLIEARPLVAITFVLVNKALRNKTLVIN